MALHLARGLSRFVIPAVVAMLTLVMTPNAEAGMNHSIFDGAPSEDQCRQCHGDNNTQPHPKLQVINSKKHHTRIEGDEPTPIIGLAEGSHDTVAPGDTSAGVYGCLSCHGVHNPETQQIEPFFTTDCLACHTASSVTGSPGMGTNVHHYTESFYNRDCSSCHSFLSSDSTDDSGDTRGMHRYGR